MIVGFAVVNRLGQALAKGWQTASVADRWLPLNERTRQPCIYEREPDAAAVATRLCCAVAPVRVCPP